MIKQLKNSNNYTLLLKRFNSRDADAFGEIYDILYNDLYYFTTSLYRNTNISAGDVIHDIFTNIWDNSIQEFNEIENLKAYIYISIKNRFKNYIIRQKRADKYKDTIKSESDIFVSSIVESEVLSVISQAMELLPSECAKVFRMHLDGWHVKDIAIVLGKAESTIYAQKQEAISILKRKMTRHSLSIISIFL